MSKTTGTLLHEYQQKYYKAEQEIKELKQMISQKDETIGLYSERLTDKDWQINHLSNDLQRLKNGIKEANSEKKFLNDKLEMFQRIHKNNDQEINDLKEELEHKKLDFQVVNEQNDELWEAVNEKDIEIDKLREKGKIIEILQSQVDELESDYRLLEEEKNEQLADKQKIINSQKEALEEFKEELSKKESELEEKTKDLNGLKASFQAVSDKNEKLHFEIKKKNQHLKEKSDIIDIQKGNFREQRRLRNIYQKQFHRIKELVDELK